MIQEIEDSRIPKGRIDLIGFGRLGLRVGIHLIQVHRGGPKEIGVFDGQKDRWWRCYFYNERC